LQLIDLKTADMLYHVYRLDLDCQRTEEMERDGEELTAASHWILPSAESFNGLWENLIYDYTIKENVNL